MLTSADSFEGFYEHFQSLLATDLELAELEHNLRGELLNMLDALADQDEALTEVEKSFEKTKLNREPLRFFDTWKFLEIDNPDKSGVREVLSNLPNAEEILTLLDQVVTKRSDIVLRKETVDKAILAAWRARHPNFSSMGSIDTDVQSETLRDSVAFARR